MGLECHSKGLSKHPPLPLQGRGPGKGPAFPRRSLRTSLSTTLAPMLQRGSDMKIRNSIALTTVKDKDIKSDIIFR